MCESEPILNTSLIHFRDLYSLFHSKPQTTQNPSLRPSKTKMYNLRRLTSYTRSSSIFSFRSTLSNLKRGQQFLGALVAVVRSIRYMYGVWNLSYTIFTPCPKKVPGSRTAISKPHGSHFLDNTSG